MSQCFDQASSRILASRVGGADPGGRGRLQCRVAVDIVAAFLGVPAADILSERRAQAPVARARHVAMYLAHVAFQLSLNAVALGFGRDRTSVSYAVARIEDERDERAFDAMLTRMEALAQSCRRLSVPGAGEGDF
ncbi:chromosomal replication initiator DnaA [Aureimonas flava]|uniref:Chromosomal replication initiator DnaA n=1 Tax=Aureimonas flava TaxID=2320271 RepID=A0A3A1WTN2_9HYPH|nr:helix-turn-helix domain-containing protein [Aureimonas flava]RIY01271.1 chromosomal replication initiator DnaA [Aureimonas flava]